MLSNNPPPLLSEVELPYCYIIPFYLAPVFTGILIVMPRLDDSGEALLRAEQGARRRVRQAWDGFCDFALRDNVLEVAVGLM